MEKFVVTPKEGQAIVVSIRTERELLEKYDELAKKTNRSRNELVNMALQFAIDNLVLSEKEEKRVQISSNN